eukprot:s5817_g1.t1
MYCKWSRCANEPKLALVTSVEVVIPIPRVPQPSPVPSPVSPVPSIENFEKYATLYPVGVRTEIWALFVTLKLQLVGQVTQTPGDGDPEMSRTSRASAVFGDLAGFWTWLRHEWRASMTVISIHP